MSAPDLGGMPQSKPGEIVKQLNKQNEEYWELVVFLKGDPDKSLSDLWIIKRPLYFLYNYLVFDTEGIFDTNPPRWEWIKVSGKSF